MSAPALRDIARCLVTCEALPDAAVATLLRALAEAGLPDAAARDRLLLGLYDRGLISRPQLRAWLRGEGREGA